MTDDDVLTQVMGIFDPQATALLKLNRGGRLLLGLPHHHTAFTRALRLYQPQRLLAKWIIMALRGMAGFRIQNYVLSEVLLNLEAQPITPPLSGIETGTCGVLLGSPEHKVRRAIASYRHKGEWEVAKISFSNDGARILEQEAQTLETLHPLAHGTPRLLGLHRGNGFTVLRMPYLTGKPLPSGDFSQAVELLATWISNHPPKPITEFSEWLAIESALSACDGGEIALRRLEPATLNPVIRHGDFARWNLSRQNNGELVVLDWEWGHVEGMPGIDLVHYFLQDARLVNKLNAHDAIKQTCKALAAPQCRSYLKMTGWADDSLLPLIACLAYKQGSGHQENREVLRSGVELANGK